MHLAHSSSVCAYPSWLIAKLATTTQGRWGVDNSQGEAEPVNFRVALQCCTAPKQRSSIESNVFSMARPSARPAPRHRQISYPTRTLPSLPIRVPPTVKQPPAAYPTPSDVTRQIRICGSVRHLRQLYLDYQESLDPIHISAIFCQIVHLYGNSQEPRCFSETAVVERFCGQLVEHSCALLDTFRARQVSNVLWAISRLPGQADQNCIQRMLRQSTTTMTTATPKDLSLMIYAVASLGCEPDATWCTAWAHQAMKIANGLNDQDVSNCLFGIARLQPAGFAAVVQTLVDHSARKLSFFSTASLASSCYALAAMGFRPSNTWHSAFVATSASRMQKFRTRELCTMLWSLERLGLVPDPELAQDQFQGQSHGRRWWAELRLTLPSRLQDCNEQDLGMATHALARMGSSGADLLHIILQRCGPQLSGFGRIGLSSLLAAAARVHPRPRSGAWLSAACDQAAALLHTFTPRDLAATARALARARHRPPPRWMVAFCLQCRAALHSFAAADVAHVLHSMAVLRYMPDRALMDWVLVEVAQKLPEFSTVALACTIWSLARLSYPVSDGWLASFLAASQPCLASFAPRELSLTLYALSHISATRGLPREWLEAFLRRAAVTSRAFCAADIAMAGRALRSTAPAWRAALRATAAQPQGWQLAVLEQLCGAGGLVALAGARPGCGAAKRPHLLSGGLTTALLTVKVVQRARPGHACQLMHSSVNLRNGRELAVSH